VRRAQSGIVQIAEETRRHAEQLGGGAHAVRGIVHVVELSGRGGPTISRETLRYMDGGPGA
jgi:hypothetical protein